MAALAAGTSVGTAAGPRNASPSRVSASLRCSVSSSLSYCSRATFLPCVSLRLAGSSGSGRAVRRLRPFLVAQRAAQAEKEEEEEEEEDEKLNGANSSSTAEAPVPKTNIVETLLNDLKEALAANDEDVVANLEAQLRLIEEERESLFQQVATLTEDISLANQRFLRLNADFDNYRKRSEREKDSLSDNAKGNVIESLLPMIDNFERAKNSIKAETEGEQKIDNSYQGIYKQFVEVMKSLGVSVVETVGKEFDPQFHEAIMREESTQYAEGVVTQEFRRGFKIGARLLRPAMVKVSAGPPAKSDSAAAPTSTEEAEKPAEVAEELAE